MKYLRPFLTVSMISLLCACGGGGSTLNSNMPASVDADNDGVADSEDAFPSVSGTDLTTFADTTILQSLSMDGNTTAPTSGAKSTTSNLWNDDNTLSYVAMLENGDIVGAPMESIPASVEFEAEGTAYMGIIDTRSQYVLTGGNVTASISADVSSLSVNLNWTGSDEIAFVSEDTTLTAPAEITMSLNSTSNGVESCGGGNLFCGGVMTIRADAAPVTTDSSLSAEQYKAGVYGSSAANAELGGRITYVEENILSAIGGFVADSK